MKHYLKIVSLSPEKGEDKIFSVASLAAAYYYSIYFRSFPLETMVIDYGEERNHLKKMFEYWINEYLKKEGYRVKELTESNYDVALEAIKECHETKPYQEREKLLENAVKLFKQMDQ